LFFIVKQILKYFVSFSISIQFDPTGYFVLRVDKYKVMLLNKYYFKVSAAKLKYIVFSLNPNQREDLI
jgi:hypothetical protein